MNEQQYMEKLNQGNHFSQSGAMEKMGQGTYYRDMPLENSISADFCTKKEMQETIKKYYKEKNVLLDPHTAVAVCVSDKMPSKKKRIIAATAHYGKFAPAVLKVFYSDDEIAKKSLKELATILQKKKPMHGPHPNLEKVINAQAVQTDTISGEYEELLQEVENFLQKQ